MFYGVVCALHSVSRSFVEYTTSQHRGINILECLKMWLVASNWPCHRELLLTQIHATHEWSDTFFGTFIILPVLLHLSQTEHIIAVYSPPIQVAEEGHYEITFDALNGACPIKWAEDWFTHTHTHTLSENGLDWPSCAFGYVSHTFLSTICIYVPRMCCC